MSGPRRRAMFRTLLEETPRSRSTWNAWVRYASASSLLMLPPVALSTSCSEETPIVGAPRPAGDADAGVTRELHGQVGVAPGRSRSGRTGVAEFHPRQAWSRASAVGARRQVGHDESTRSVRRRLLDVGEGRPRRGGQCVAPLQDAHERSLAFGVARQDDGVPADVADGGAGEDGDDPVRNLRTAGAAGRPGAIAASNCTQRFEVAQRSSSGLRAEAFPQAVAARGLSVAAIALACPAACR